MKLALLLSLFSWAVVVAQVLRFPLGAGLFSLLFPISINQWCVLKQVPRGCTTQLIVKFPSKWRVNLAAWSLICTEWAKISILSFPLSLMKTFGQLANGRREEKYLFRKLNAMPLFGLFGVWATSLLCLHFAIKSLSEVFIWSEFIASQEYVIGQSPIWCQFMSLIEK